jgi:hypothetical protein
VYLYRKKYRNRRDVAFPFVPLESRTYHERGGGLLAPNKDSLCSTSIIDDVNKQKEQKEC